MYKNGTGSKHGSWPLDYALLVTWQEGKHPGVLDSTYKIASSHIKGRKKPKYSSQRHILNLSKGMKVRNNMVAQENISCWR